MLLINVVLMATVLTDFPMPSRSSSPRSELTNIRVNVHIPQSG